MRMLTAILSLVLAFCCRAEELAPGTSVFGQRNFIEYIPGDLPLVIAVPHGGREKPADIPDRTSGVTDMDAHTQELARSIAAVVHARTGRHAHVVICRLHRSKLHANRDLYEAAEGNAIAEQAWKEHHAFIEQACAAAVRRFGVAFLIDLHGHGHPDPRIELGYLHSALDLADCDEVLNSSKAIAASSLRWIVERGSLSHIDLLRGPQSLGALLEREGFPATPSPRMPVPTEPFFRGGYTIARHCKSDKNVTGLQIEANRPRLRDTEENRQNFAHSLTAALHAYFTAHLGLGMDGGKNTVPDAPIVRLYPPPRYQPSQYPPKSHWRLCSQLRCAKGALEKILDGWTTSNEITVAAGSGGTLTLAYPGKAAFSDVFSALNDDLRLHSDALEGFAMRITGGGGVEGMALGRV